MRILVTGADGFLGSHLIPRLIAANYGVRKSTRTIAPDLTGIDAIIHLAALAHGNYGEENIDLVNHRWTAQLAQDARAADVRRFLFVSSIAAQVGPFSYEVQNELSPPCPTTAYGRSKLAGEMAVIKSGTPYTILRPAVVIGPHAKGNIATLRRIADLPLPLPFGKLKNKRSVLSIENFDSAVLIALRRDDAVNSTYVVADPVPLTLGEIVTRLREENRRRANLLNVSEKLIETTCRLMGQSKAWDRIGRPLVVDPAKLLSIGWRPT